MWCSAGNPASGRYRGGHGVGAGRGGRRLVPAPPQEAAGSGQGHAEPARGADPDKKSTPKQNKTKIANFETGAVPGLRYASVCVCRAERCCSALNSQAPKPAAPGTRVRLEIPADKMGNLMEKGTLHQRVHCVLLESVFSRWITKAEGDLLALRPKERAAGPERGLRVLLW